MSRQAIYCRRIIMSFLLNKYTCLLAIFFGMNTELRMHLGARMNKLPRICALIMSFPVTQSRWSKTWNSEEVGEKMPAMVRK